MIITLTVNPALDIYTTIGKLEPNTKLRCGSNQIDPGGGGVNITRAIHRLGGDSVAIYTKGGFTGKMYSKLLDEENILQNPVEIKADTRQNFAVRETDSGNLYRFGMPGPILDEGEYNQILDMVAMVKKADFFIVSGSLPPDAPPDFYVQVAKKVKKNNIKFILDTSGKALPGILTEGAYLLKPSIEELEDLTGESARDLEKQKELLLGILSSYEIGIIVLSLGADGALLAQGNKVEHLYAPKIEARSAIGAGDSMVAGIVHSLKQGKTLHKAVLYGIACGSAALLTAGTKLLYKKDADRLYDEMLAEQS